MRLRGAEIWRSLRQAGVKGLLFHAAAKSFQAAADFLVAAGERLPAPEREGGVSASRARETLRRNREIRGRHAGRRCVVIANGPSLAGENLASLAREVTITVNAFWRHPASAAWSPTYHCLQSPAFFDGSGASLRFWRDARARMPGTKFALPLWALPAVERDSLVPVEGAYFARFQPRAVPGLRGSPDFERAIPVTYMVSQFAILLALYLGCDPVFLLGFDHDWLARGEYRNFHAESTLEGHPTDRKPSVREWGYRRMLLRDLRAWGLYEAIGAWARRKGRNIVNLTPGGCLDVFRAATEEERLSVLEGAYPSVITPSRSLRI